MVRGQSAIAERQIQDDPAKIVPMLDDQLSSIELFDAFLKKKGLETNQQSGLVSFGNFIEDELPDAKQVPCFVLDMHLRRTPDLSDLNLPHVKTQRSTAVGLAVAEHYLFPNEKFFKTPVILLTGFEIKKSVRERVKRLQQRHKITILEKKDLSKFKEYIANILAEDPAASVGKQLRDRAMSVSEFIDEGVGVVDRIFDGWNLTPLERAAAFGIEKAESSDDWEKAKEDIRAFRSELVVQQIKLIARIKAALAALFREDDSAEARWLRQPLEALDGMTAIDLLLSGKQSDLDFLLRVLHRATG